MRSKKFIKSEISITHYLLLATSKLLIGIGIGIVLATKFFYIQPYWYVLILAGTIILIPLLRFLTKQEFREEMKLKKKL